MPPYVRRSGRGRAQSASPETIAVRITAFMAVGMAIVGLLVAVALVVAFADASAATPPPTAVVVAEFTAPEPVVMPEPPVTPAAPPTARPTPSPEETRQPPATAHHENGVVTFGDGTYDVGANLPPGTYRAANPSGNCYWGRTENPIPGLELGMGSSAAGAAGPQLVTISATDDFFETAHCGTWTSDLRPVTASRTSFADGIFIVGVDVAPGTYTSPGDPECYWQRMSSFDGSPDETIVDYFSQGHATSQTITIEATDKGFMSLGCGTWNKP